MEINLTQFFKAVPLFQSSTAINDAGRLPALHKCPAVSRLMLVAQRGVRTSELQYYLLNVEQLSVLH